MKKQTRQQKYNIKDISYTWGHHRIYGLTNSTILEGITNLSLYYNGILIYYINSKPLGLNILGGKLEGNK